MAELSLATVDSLIRKSGARRVSADAAAALRDIIEDMAVDIAERAAEIAMHVGRKTVNAEDIKIAAA
jgi:histone H3/H4